MVCLVFVVVKKCPCSAMLNYFFINNLWFNTSDVHCRCDVRIFILLRLVELTLRVWVLPCCSEG